MSPIRRVARPMIAGIFLTGGLASLRQPGPRVEMVKKAGLDAPEQLVRVNAVAQLVAGLALATNRAPRLSALVLAGSLVPTTVIDHPFWSEKDKVVRKQQQAHVVTNLSVLGGLLLAVVDTGGRESLPHATGRRSRAAKASVASAGRDASTTAKHLQKDAKRRAAKAQKALTKAQVRSANR